MSNSFTQFCRRLGRLARRPAAWACAAAAVCAATVAVAPPPAAAADAKPAVATTAPSTAPAVPASFKLGFRPNASDAAARRVGGITRSGGPGEPEVKISIVAPSDKVATTTKEQPVLYWYASKPIEKVRVMLQPVAVGGKVQDSILERTWVGHRDAGYQRLDLSKVTTEDGKPVKLEPNTQYEWVVEAMIHRKGQSNNPKASCRLVRVAPPAGLENGTTNLAEAAQRYAAAGVWIDTLAALNDLIDASKNDKATQDTLRSERRELLKTEGLNENAAGQIEETAAAPAK